MIKPSTIWVTLCTCIDGGGFAICGLMEGNGSAVKKSLTNASNRDIVFVATSTDSYRNNYAKMASTRATSDYIELK